MKFQDALFNWLQIKVVADARPADAAAQETVKFFTEILTEDHGVSDLQVDATAHEEFYDVSWTTPEGPRQQRFEKLAVDQLLADIQAEPKYNEQ